jgi:hypothetical protein
MKELDHLPGTGRQALDLPWQQSWDIPCLRKILRYSFGE